MGEPKLVNFANIHKMVFRKASICLSIVLCIICFKQVDHLDKALEIQYDYGEHLLTECKDINLNEIDLENWVDGCYHFLGHYKILNHVTGTILPDMNQCASTQITQEAWQWQKHYENLNDQQNEITSVGWRNADPDQTGSAYDPSTFKWPSSNPIDHKKRIIKNDRKNLRFEPYNIKDGYVPVYFDGFEDYVPDWVRWWNKGRWEKVRAMAYERQMESLISLVGSQASNLINGTFFSGSNDQDVMDQTRLSTEFNPGFPLCMNQNSAEVDLSPANKSSSEWESTANYGDSLHYWPCFENDNERKLYDYKIQSNCQGTSMEKVRVIGQIRKVEDPESGQPILILGYMEDHKNWPHSFNSRPMAPTTLFAIGEAKKTKQSVMGMEYGVPSELLKFKKVIWGLFGILFMILPIGLFVLYYMDFEAAGNLRYEDGRYKGANKQQMGVGGYKGITKKQEYN